MAILLVAASGALTGCRHTRVATEGYAPEKIKYDETYDWEIKEVLALARENRWEEASARAAALRQKDPQNPMLERIHNWTVQQGRKHREQALEDGIREIDAKSSVFSPSITDLLLEQKERGLPATKDVRDTVDRIDSTPYIPETFGKTLREKGPLFDLDSSKGRMARILEKEVSIHLDNVPLETIIVNISQSAGINIVADKSLPALKQTLSVHLDKVRLDEFFRYISRNYDLQFQVGDELVWVVDAKDPKHLMEETRFYRLRKGFVLPAQFGADEATIQRVQANNVVTTTETQKFRKFVNDETPTMPSLERAIKELFTGSKFLIDYERNLVVARGTP
ncbi:MAG TPA: type II secretion system protein GspD, partial [Verrucomicrobiota bacterium]|nr:type II secretion system protein GspD [Verrucomicrobiota bacterium]